MKSFIILLLTAMALGSCEDRRTHTDKINDLKSPVVLKAKSVSLFDHAKIVILIDSDKKLFTLNTGSDIAEALYNTYNVGDTIR